MESMIIDSKYNESVKDIPYNVKDISVNKSDKFEKLLGKEKEKIEKDISIQSKNNIKKKESHKEKKLGNDKENKKSKKIDLKHKINSDKKITKDNVNLKVIINEIKVILKNLDESKFSNVFDKFKHILGDKEITDAKKKIKLLNFLKEIKKLVASIQNTINGNYRFLEQNNTKREKDTKSEDKKEDEIKISNKIKVIDKRKHRNKVVAKQGHPMLKKENSENKMTKSNKSLLNLNTKNIKAEKFDNILKAEKDHTPSKAEINKMIESIVQRGKITLSEGKSEVVMRLKPDFLGDMLLKLDINNKGKLEGKIIVNNMMAEKVLKDNLSQLKVSFQNMGLDVGNFNIDLKEGFNFSSSHDRRFGAENSGTMKYGSILSEGAISGEDVMGDNFITNYYLTDWLASNVNMRV